MRLLGWAAVPTLLLATTLSLTAAPVRAAGGDTSATASALTADDTKKGQEFISLGQDARTKLATVTVDAQAASDAATQINKSLPSKADSASADQLTAVEVLVKSATTPDTSTATPGLFKRLSISRDTLTLNTAGIADDKVGILVRYQSKVDEINQIKARVKTLPADVQAELDQSTTLTKNLKDQSKALETARTNLTQAIAKVAPAINDKVVADLQKRLVPFQTVVLKTNDPDSQRRAFAACCGDLPDMLQARRLVDAPVKALKTDLANLAKDTNLAAGGLPDNAQIPDDLFKNTDASLSTIASQTVSTLKNINSGEAEPVLSDAKAKLALLTKNPEDPDIVISTSAAAKLDTATATDLDKIVAAMIRLSIELGQDSTLTNIISTGSSVPQQIVDARAVLEPLVAQIDLLVTQLNSPHTVDLHDWSFASVNLYYFDDVARLMNVLSKGTTVQGGDTAARAAANSARDALDTKTQTLINARQTVNNARAELAREQERLADAQAQASAAHARADVQRRLDRHSSTTATQDVTSLQKQLDLAKAQQTLANAQLAEAQTKAQAAQTAVDNASAGDTDIATKKKTLTQRVSDQDRAQNRADQATLSVAARQADVTAATSDQTSLTNNSTAEEKDADAAVTDLDSKVTTAQTKLDNAEQGAHDAQTAVGQAASDAYVAALADNRAFAYARDNAPFLVSLPDPTNGGNATDPVQRCYLYGFPDSKTIFIRGSYTDVQWVRRLISQFDVPQAQALMTLWTMNISGDGDRFGMDHMSNALKLVEEALDNTRDSTNDALNALTESINDVANQAQTDALPELTSTAPAVRYNFFRLRQPTGTVNNSLTLLSSQVSNLTDAATQLKTATDSLNASTDPTLAGSARTNVATENAASISDAQIEATINTASNAIKAANASLNKISTAANAEEKNTAVSNAVQTINTATVKIQKAADTVAARTQLASANAKATNEKLDAALKQVATTNHALTESKSNEDNAYKDLLKKQAAYKGFIENTTDKKHRDDLNKAKTALNNKISVRKNAQENYNTALLKLRSTQQSQQLTELGFSRVLSNLKDGTSGIQRLIENMSWQNAQIRGQMTAIQYQAKALDEVNSGINNLSQSINDGTVDQTTLRAVSMYDPDVLLRLNFLKGFADSASNPKQGTEHVAGPSRFLQAIVPDPQGTTTLAEALVVLSLSKEKYQQEVLSRFKARTGYEFTNLTRFVGEGGHQGAGIRSFQRELVTELQRAAVDNVAEYIQRLCDQRDELRYAKQVANSKQLQGSTTPPTIPPNVSTTDVDTAINTLDSEIKPPTKWLMQTFVNPDTQDPAVDIHVQNMTKLTLRDNVEKYRRESPLFSVIENARVAALNETLKQYLRSIDDDMQREIVRPHLSALRQALFTSKGISVGILQRTSILASNRLVARVDPSATSEIGPESLAEESDITGSPSLSSILQMSGQLAQVFTSMDPGALAAKTALGGLQSAFVPRTNGGVPPSAGSGYGQPYTTAGTPSAKQTSQSGVYGVTTGNVFQITPVFDPTGQALRFRFDFVGASQIREPDNTTNRQLSQIERHSVNTQVQLSNQEIRLVSEYESNVKLGLPARKTGGIPIVKDLPILKEVPLIGWFTKRDDHKPVVQESLILAQTAMFPTIGDVINLLTRQIGSVGTSLAAPTSPAPAPQTPAPAPQTPT